MVKLLVAVSLLSGVITDELFDWLTRLAFAVADFMVAVKPAGLLDVMLTLTLFVKSWSMGPLAQVFGLVIATVRISLMLTLRVVLSVQVVIPFDVLQLARTLCAGIVGRADTTAIRRIMARILTTLNFSAF